MDCLFNKLPRERTAESYKSFSFKGIKDTEAWLGKLLVNKPKEAIDNIRIGGKSSTPFHSFCGCFFSHYRGFKYNQFVPMILAVLASLEPTQVACWVGQLVMISN